jgi:hypothetical protein
MAGYLLAISTDSRVVVDRIMDQLVAPSLYALEHKLLSAHWRPFNKRYIVIVSLGRRTGIGQLSIAYRNYKTT